MKQYNYKYSPPLGRSLAQARAVCRPTNLVRNIGRSSVASCVTDRPLEIEVKKSIGMGGMVALTGGR